MNLAHDIDLLRHLCGEIDFVQAQTVKSIRGFENEDVAGALLRFRNGAIGTISVSDSIVSPWSWEMTSKENPVYPPTSESCYFIGGSHGSLSIPLIHYIIRLFILLTLSKRKKILLFLVEKGFLH